MSVATDLTVAKAREILRPHGWMLRGNRSEGYLLVTKPERGDFSTGPFDTPGAAVLEARDLATTEAERAAISGDLLPPEPDPCLAVIAFQPEAWESAGVALHRLEGWTVDAVPVDGEPFTATVGDVVYPEGGGGPQVELQVWIDGDPGDEVRTLDIFDEIVRLEVC